MVAKEITSLQHPLVKEAVRLRLERKKREQEKSVLISGKKMIFELSENLEFNFLFYTGPLSKKIRANETISVSKAVLKKITGLQEPDGWAAILSMPSPQPLREKNRILIVDRISDPGNLGTLWRTALALQWEGIWITENTTDPFNEKALRAAKGATFHLPYEQVSPSLIQTWVRQRNGMLYVADLKGIPLTEYEHTQAPVALLLGNEARGPSAWTKSLGIKITLPLHPLAESLNVASAGAILLYAMRPQ